MSAELVSINHREPSPDARRLRHRELWDAETSAENELERHLIAVGCLLGPVGPGAPPRTEAERLLVRKWKATEARITFFEGRIRQLERILRLTFESDALTDDQRVSILEALCGKRAGRRDSRLLSEAEERIVKEYRKTDPAGKQMFRTLLARLATTNAETTGDGGA